jgi:hypothetical protein
MDVVIKKDAKLSGCRLYRYSLVRVWNEKLKSVVFIGLNPSTADEENDDRTIRRCIGFAERWGYGGIIMLNLFAYRATKPRDMMAFAQPIGEENDKYLKELCCGLDVIAMWGNAGTYLNRDKSVLEMLPNIQCLGVTKAGCPKHILYLPYVSERQRLK